MYKPGDFIHLRTYDAEYKVVVCCTDAEYACHLCDFKSPITGQCTLHHEDAYICQEKVDMSCYFKIIKLVKKLRDKQYNYGQLFKVSSTDGNDYLVRLRKPPIGVASPCEECDCDFKAEPFCKLTKKSARFCRHLPQRGYLKIVRKCIKQEGVKETE